MAVALASAGFTAAANFGQTVSPYFTNFASKAFFGEATTGGVYLISAIGMAASAFAYALVKKRK